MNPDIVTHVIGGYLGAGKTSFVRSVLTTTTIPVAVIVNDFGSINIDRELLSRHGDNLVEMTNGCLCCAVGDSLAEAIFTIMEHPQRPSTLLIETSGVADPAAVNAFTHLPGLVDGGTVVLVDAANALATHRDRRVTRTFERQLRAADLVAITKTDIVEANQARSVVDLVASIVEDTPILKAHPEVLGRIVAPLAVTTPIVASHDEFIATHETDFVFDDEQALRAHLEALPASTVRVKGIVALSDGSVREVHRVGALVSVTMSELAPTGMIVIEAPSTTSGHPSRAGPGID